MERPLGPGQPKSLFLVVMAAHYGPPGLHLPRIHPAVRLRRRGNDPIAQNPRDRRAQARVHKEREKRRLRRLHVPGATARAHGPRSSEVLDYYAQTSRTRPSRTRGQKTLVFPEQFSFIENPEGTLEVLEQFVRAAAGSRVDRIFVDQRGCQLIDLGAEAVLSALGREGRKVGKEMGGYFPTSTSEHAIVEAVGLPRALGITTPRSDFEVFELRRGRRRGLDRATSAEVATTDLVEYVDRCLRLYGHAFTDSGKQLLAELVGEVITNAEEHSLRPEWWVSAYLRQHEKGEWGDCHIAMFNFGRSLAQSLRTLPHGSILRGEIERLVDLHKGERAFVRRIWEEDDLWTLYALQGKVSRRNRGTTSVGDNGQGTVKMIQMFQDLGGRRRGNPKMCVVSGNTHILFDGTYPMRAEEGRPPRVAFNSANDLAERPDPKYVRHLERSFPGTVISLRFDLDKEHLNELTGKQTDRRSWRLPFGRE